MCYCSVAVSRRGRVTPRPSLSAQWLPGYPQRQPSSRHKACPLGIDPQKRGGGGVGGWGGAGGGAAAAAAARLLCAIPSEAALRPPPPINNTAVPPHKKGRVGLEGRAGGGVGGGIGGSRKLLLPSLPLFLPLTPPCSTSPL